MNLRETRAKAGINQELINHELVDLYVKGPRYLRTRPTLVQRPFTWVLFVISLCIAFAITFGEGFADLGLFTLQALVFMLAGGAAMMLIDGAERLFLRGRVSQRQYLVALGASFFLGMFFQWEHAYRNLQTVQTQNQSLSTTMGTLQTDLQTKDNKIETLERQLRATAKDTTVAALQEKVQILQEKVQNKDSQIVSLQNRPSSKTKMAAMRNKLAQLRAQGNRLVDKTLSNLKSPPPIDERRQWFTNTLQYLQQNMDADHVEEFKNPPTSAMHFMGVPARHDLFAVDVEVRVKVLQKFTDELRDKD